MANQHLIMHAKNYHGGTATQRSMFDNHCPRRHGAGKYHFVISLHKYIWANTIKSRSDLRRRRAAAGNKLSNALCRRAGACPDAGRMVI